MAPPPVLRSALRSEALEVGEMIAAAGSPQAGAIVVFLGTARDHSQGKEGITHLEYEAYPEHVVPKLDEILEEAAGKWDLVAALVEHRVGEVKVGEASVAVVVSSSHREEAFAAGRYIIEELKKRAPLWKKEHWPGGGEWVEGA
jgi:molybdopterin synthase catalytic subunit